MNLFNGRTASAAEDISDIHPGRYIATGVVSAFTAGLLFALSFIATPVKFMAANVPLEQLLAVGRVTFRASAGAEALLLFALLILAPRGLRRWPIGIAVVLAAQFALLLPVLDERALAVMAGQVLPPTVLHEVWIAADVARIAAYLALCVMTLRTSAEWRPRWDRRG